MQVSFHKLCAQFSSSHSLCNRKMARERERENGDGYCCLSMHTFFNDVVMVIVVVWSHYVYRLLLFGTNLPRSCNNNNNSNIDAWYALPELSWAVHIHRGMCIPILHSPLHICPDRLLCCVRVPKKPVSVGRNSIAAVVVDVAAVVVATTATSNATAVAAAATYCPKAFNCFTHNRLSPF